MASIEIVAGKDKKEVFAQVVAKGCLKRSTDLLGLWGSIVGHSIVVSCDACGQDHLPMFMEYYSKGGRQTHLCMDCVAVYAKLAYPSSSDCILSVPQKEEV